MGLHSTKNFVTTNAILSKPKQIPGEFRWVFKTSAALPDKKPVEKPIEKQHENTNTAVESKVEPTAPQTGLSSMHKMLHSTTQMAALPTSLIPNTAIDQHQKLWS